MKIRIEQLGDTDAAERTILVRGVAGAIGGVIERSGLSIGKSYDAELNLECPLLMNENVWTTDERAYRAAYENEHNTLVGWVDGVDDDGLVYFRLGIDALLMVEIEPVPRVGEWLRLVVPSVETRVFLVGNGR